jgi:hypothetical protein
MIDCSKLIHPFQNDPGVSQADRIMNELLAGAPNVDARSLADLLDYFTQLAPDINYYDTNLAITDWKPFFKNSLPFLLAAVIKTKTGVIEEKFNCYNNLILKSPSPSGLQLNLFYVYYNIFKKINTWHLQIKNSKLPIELFIEKLIKNKLKQPFITFSSIENAAVKYYCVKKIDFTEIISNPVWNIRQKDLFPVDTKFLKIHSNRKRLIALQNELSGLFPSLLEALKTLPVAAEGDLQTSLLPLNEDLQKKHEPHLALIFVFLSMFQKLQGDLNGFTKKHLDFFYQNVLQLQPQGAVPDKANILIQLQNQVQKYYLLPKGTLVKDGKDNNKQQILFSLDDDIVVNKTQVADVKTLFVNNQIVYGSAYIEGVYMAIDATKADGVDKSFADGEPANYPTVGAKNSKYIAPGTDFFQPYPNARIGFILASPVLFLQGGTRTITITLSCKFNYNCGQTIATAAQPVTPCCQGTNSNPDADQETFPNPITADALYPEVRYLFGQTFIYITDQLLENAKQKWASSQDVQDVLDAIRENYLLDNFADCKKSPFCDDIKFYRQSATINFADDWIATIRTVIAAKHPSYTALDINSAVIRLLQIFPEIFPPFSTLDVLFSGEKDWIAPEIDPLGPYATVPLLNLYMYLSSSLGADNSFTITIVATLRPDQPAVTFYDKTNLKEDFNTTQPLVKIQLSDKIKMSLEGGGLQSDLNLYPSGNCCLDREVSFCDREISLYNFFRNVIIEDAGIDVKVCGLKNFIVQNDESVQDVNSLIYPFGTRPKVNSNFFIGSEEIFMKNWTDVWVDVFWKDFPSEGFANYYNGYQYEYRDTTGAIIKKVDEIADSNFLMQPSFLQDGNWFSKPGAYPCTVDPAKTPHYDLLFPATLSLDCFGALATNFTSLFTHQYYFAHSDFISTTPNENISYTGIKRMDANSRQFFLRLSLACQDFQHDKYPIILGRQLTAAAKLPDLTDSAVYYNINTAGDITKVDVTKIFKDIDDAQGYSELIKPKLKNLINEILSLTNNFPGPSIANITVDDIIWQAIFSLNFPNPHSGNNDISDSDLNNEFILLYNILSNDKTLIDNFQAKGAVLPNEPWTPIISNIALDYTASATAKDIDLIHLYPYDGTYMEEEIQLQPTLFPTFCDEGTLFLGLQNLVPGENVNILFQLAEATSDSETDPQDVFWYFLANNTWQQLRNQFEVLNDATDNLTTSGIIKFSLPENISSDNTIMPAGLFWIKAAIPKNSGDVSETTGIFTQAISVTFTNDDVNDKLRLNTPLPAGSISKLNTADANIKEVDQPYDSFGGAVPELQMQYYVRVSELLRHKGRAIQKFDYERLVLQAFPQVFKAKCINHSFGLNAHLYVNDFPFAPGYVLLAVIPDLNQLKAGNSFQPKVPVSILEKIEKYLQTRTSPFVRFRAMNPRYESVDFFVTVKLRPGKDKNFYKEQLAEAIREFMAPWAVGDYYKLTFGQCVSRSDIIQFLETRDYVDYIQGLKMLREDDLNDPCQEPLQICPATPRSILIAGDIDVCIVDGCEEWGCDKCDHVPVPLNDYCKEKVKS